jgi:hypothetical protein
MWLWIFETLLPYGLVNSKRLQTMNSRFLLARMYQLPVTSQYKQKEWTNILHIAENSGYPLSLIIKLNTHLQLKLSGPHTTNEHTNNPKLWTTFTFHSSMICKITSLFKSTNLKIAFYTNTSHNILNTRNHNTNTYTHSGIYQMICHTYQCSLRRANGL